MARFYSDRKAYPVNLPNRLLNRYGNQLRIGRVTETRLY